MCGGAASTLRREGNHLSAPANFEQNDPGSGVISLIRIRWEMPGDNRLAAGEALTVGALEADDAGMPHIHAVARTGRNFGTVASAQHVA